MASGLDATGGDGANDKERWKNGHVLTFWAYDYNHQGSTQYHVYYNNKTCCSNIKDGQRFTLSTYKQTDEVNDLEKDPKHGWTHAFTFWAFEDKFVDEFVGKNDACY